MESLHIINRRLKEIYGKFENGEPHWRVVWSEDQFEKRITDRTREGLALMHPEVVELPKYRQWIHNKFVLERLIPIPEFVETDLISKTSYEPVWVFEDKKGNPLPPKWEAIQLIIKTVYENASRYVGAKYKDPESGLKPDELKEVREKRIEALHNDLFGNETEIGDALAYKEGITVPKNYGDTKQ